MRCLEDYRKIVGEEAISHIHRKARPLYGKHVVHINSTFQAGGVAEILQGLIFIALCREWLGSNLLVTAAILAV